MSKEAKRGLLFFVASIAVLMTAVLFFLSAKQQLRQSKEEIALFKGPRVAVEPQTVRLGVAKVLGTKIVFEGSGFEPNDSIYVELIGPNQVKLIVAEALTKPDGTFRAEVGKLAKITELLRADASFEITEKYEYKELIIVTQPPIPEGVYTVKVVCMLSKLTAETKLAVKGPSILDDAKDFLGRMTGKIRYGKSK